MAHARRPLLSGLARAGALLAITLSQASAQGVAARPEITDAIQRLATEDAALQRQRFGDLAAVAGKPWLSAVPGELASVWRDVQWIVPGAAMRFQRGFCLAAKCQGTEYLVRYDAAAKQLEFVEQGAVQYLGRILEDGSVRMTGTGLLGVLTAETLRFDAAANVLHAEKHALRAATPAELAAATHGFVAAPAVQAPQAASEADLRAELAAMKAKVEALSKQVEQQQASAEEERQPRLTPAQAREAERRAQREAQAKAAEEKRLAAQAKAREEAERRAEARERARREAEAKAAEAKHLAEEKRAEATRIAEEKRAAAEAQKRAIAEAREAEVRRAAEERQAREDARKAAEAERVARAAPPAAAAKAPAAPAADGRYTTSSGYTLNVEFRGDVLVVKEPNKESPYRRTGPNFYEFTNPTNGIAYCMRVVDARTLEACKPGQAPGMGTRLTLAGDGAGVPSGERDRLERIARSYADRARTEPANTQAWSFCSLAAMSRATGGGQAQLLQAASALRSIATTPANPCPDAIPQAAWAAAQ
ncbi:hypothetical protein H8N03_00810 [Ramlibacter sp. USB13]|uniref:Uncharacterized protein n=1 Tax=Ramlibacter cellulosilyticus TaxID=2764187 RepID=A0A923MMF8_9BURK|nr:hypothetical protein [Ramlibacter cellulosilyticus]MBC5781461.1 hypothetical protein [Ramlibacter cellulosilyticus]